MSVAIDAKIIIPDSFLTGVLSLSELTFPECEKCQEKLYGRNDT